jgi:iron complex transport system substrate-binding protein
MPGAMAGLTTVGPKSFLAELVEIAGGRNVFSEMDAPYPQISKESLIVRDPRVILELRPGEDLDEEATRSLRQDWQALPTLRAVREGRIHVLTDEVLLVPGPRIVRAARILARAIHGEGAQ